eukprot:TRINITY_DN2434_c0_g2_i1.p1 TRINITY_DN2434_c0_g2~~TRINITY_DN2434_c0_g2_i1.p1  ORF type:complete len:769 (-),score=148.12 TRINITY_DN2434_c0_g2_i1:94-2400(-)
MEVTNRLERLEELQLLLDSAFAEQKDWIDKRFQQHEHIIERLARAEKSSRGENHDRLSRQNSKSVATSTAEFGSISSARIPLRRDVSSSSVDDVHASSNQGVWSQQKDMFAEEASSQSSTTTCEPVQELARQLKNLPGQIVAPEVMPPLLRQAAIIESSVVEEDEEFHSLIVRLEDLFDRIDADRSGTINRTELRHAFADIGMPSIASVTAFLEESSNMEIDRLDWLHMIEDASKDDPETFMVFAKRLLDAQSEHGSLCEASAWSRCTCFIRHDSNFRMAWDFLMMILLVWVCLTMPFSMGFGQEDVLADVDQACDVFFLMDVAFNFRTTFIDQNDIIVTNGKKMAMHYLKTWFTIDIVSSIPWDWVTAGLLPSLQPARLLKIGKVAKVFKLLRIGKMLRSMASSEFLEMMEDQFSPKASQTAGRVISLIVTTTMVCHWLACCLAVFNEGCLDEYFHPQHPTKMQLYIASLYWAVTTLTTVGYGDIIPTSNQERAYGMLAMLIGSAFYGYIIGCITSVITDMDIDKRTFNERMEVVQAWLEFHERMPAVLRRRIRRHFKEHYRNRTIADDATIVSELAGVLRSDTAYFIIHEKVRSNPSFRGLPASALSSLVCVLKKTSAKAGENIVIAGDPGTAMYVITDGQASISKGDRWIPPGMVVALDVLSRFKELDEGESFGEEVMFSLEQTYQYTVTATTAVAMYELSVDSFKHRFRNMPELIQRMTTNFLKGRKLLLRDGRQENVTRGLLGKVAQEHSSSKCSPSPPEIQT